MRRKLSILLLSAILVLSAFGFVSANPYEVTEPITITWWHAHEKQWHDTLNYMVEKFNAENPLITVEPVYIGNYREVQTRLIAAVASGDVPALATSNTAYPAAFGAAGICEILDPYIEAFDFNLNDYGEGLVNSTIFEGEVITLPYLTSTQVMYYNKTAAEAEGIEMPRTFADMDAFLEKATIFNEDGTTARYGTVFGGWDYIYFEMIYRNNGVKLVLEDGLSTDVNSEMSVYITTKIKEWIDKGYAYFAYGTGSSSAMRQRFWDGEAFSVFHTSSLYDTYVENIGGKFEVGIAWTPGSIDGQNFYSQVSGSTILIPAVASQRQKNAAWQFMMFMASPEMNLYWADETGYFPTRRSLIGTPEYEEYLERKPAMETVVNMSNWIVGRNNHPAFDSCALQWRDALATIFNEGAPVQATLDRLADSIVETLEDF
ncbi:MAG: extracellular solute-binding protein [Firmicutes bacterium]|nr:extracellular solute-binding protein [Bacillota bacterium]